MKTVAIIGAGPSGLVTAKTLLRSTRCKYDVRVFEKGPEVGGLWAVHRDRPYDGMLNPEMPTNLSRFNIGFSDLSWSSIGLDGHVPYWPRAWQVGQYIRAYVKKYIPEGVISFNTRVTIADVESTKNGIEGEKWKVKWQTSPDGQSNPSDHEGLFDHLVIATGLFSASSMPQFLKTDTAHVKMVHSTKLRNLTDVAPGDPAASGVILVVGGGMSGGDAATVLASQLSDAAYAPTSNGKAYNGLKLVQLCPEPAYALPLAASVAKEDTPAPNFLPLDLAMYNLSKRPPGPIELKVGKVPSDVVATVHKAFQNIVGDQSDLNTPSLRYSANTKAPYVTLTERYSGFIRAGNINIMMGRLLDLVTSSEGRVCAMVQGQAGREVIDDVVGCVFATGFSPQPALSFLGPAVRQALNYDPDHNRLPIILDEYATMSYKIPSLAVIGYHEGAFWGSMEMEARLAEYRWSTKADNNGTTLDDKKTLSQRKELMELRLAMTERHEHVPQYWMGDYVGLMETIARDTDTKRDDLGWPDRSGPVTIYRYADATEQRVESQTSLTEFLSILQRSESEGLFVARAAFLAMHGHWSIHRRIQSALDTMPSGELIGTASFHPRSPTSVSYDFEYLYTEKGKFQMDNGMQMQASRQYVYRYQEASDQITVWFVKDDGRTVDYLYHNLKFDVDARENGWRAKADHLCIADMYKSDYRFHFRGANLMLFDIIHAVQGPKKNYVSETKFSR